MLIAAARLKSPFAVQFHRQGFFQRAVAVTAGVEGARAAEHGQAAAVADEIAHSF